MTPENVDSHVLIIHDQPEPRQFFLRSATYSIGRDKHNSIVIPHRAISRQHALLLRMPLPAQAGYRYRILDGNASGKPSLNGLSINGVQCTTHDLTPHDTILIGGQIQIEYQIVSIKYFDYLKIQTPVYLNVKAKATSSSATPVRVEASYGNAPHGHPPNDPSSAPPLDDFEDDFYPTELFRGRS